MPVAITDTSEPDRNLTNMAWVTPVVLSTLLAIVGLLAVALLSGRHSRHELGLVVGRDRLDLHGEDVTWDSLCDHLRQTLSMDKTLVISAEPDTPFGLVQKAQTISQDCGIQRISLQPLPKAVPGPGILDATQKRSNICERHNVKMEVELVPIFYGLPVGDPAYWKESQHAAKEFPHARSSYGGGCLVWKEKQALVYVCKKCRAARRQYTLTKAKS